MTSLINENSIIYYTFQHLTGFGKKKESALWKAGIKNWEDFDKINGNQLNVILDEISIKRNSILFDSWKSIEIGNVDYFAERLPKQEYYRLILSFPKDTIYLDIETTGLSLYYDKITLVGWSFANDYDVYLQGDKIDKLYEVLNKAKAIVTFNGSIFDLPFLRNEFPDIKIPVCHVDLRFFVRRIGLSGGQKKVEEDIRYNRPDDIKDIKGFKAPILWYKYRLGDINALRKLIMYNYYDIEGMKYIFDKTVIPLFKMNKLPVQIDTIYKFSHNSEINNERNIKQINKIRIKKFKGTPGPLIRLDELKFTNRQEKIKIVGIDLSGSESRASGWCFLEHNHAITKNLFTDEKIINETINTQPDIISIDSPLSIPVGRISVSDDDPGRKIYGITRYCERLLKKRGISVYPCLINSMQHLTERGIRLATHFRSLGIPVIESYPGAVQDIIDIPRKRASLEYLQNGLEKFGIKGDFIKNAVSHDELDAITSAIVGHFFWSGKFEALGNEEEDYLIIPDLKKHTDEWLNKKVIGISGPIAAGKTTASGFIKSVGYSYGRFSLVLKKLLEDDGIEPHRQNLQKTGDEVNIKKGQRWLGKKLIELLPKNCNIVIDGLRFPEDHAFMKETYGPAFFLIYINAPTKTRKLRYLGMGGTQEEFDNANSHNVERLVKNLSNIADIKINNEKNIDNFEKDIVTIINSL